MRATIAFVFFFALAVCWAQAEAKRSAPARKQFLNKVRSTVRDLDTGLEHGVVFEHGEYLELREDGSRVPFEVPSNISCALVEDGEQATEAPFASRNLDLVPFFPGCYPQDATVTRTFRLGLVLDQSLLDRFAGDRGAASRWAEDVIVNVRLAYYRQLNVVLEVGSIRFAVGDGSPLAQPLGACNLDASGYLRDFQRWVQAHPNPGNGVEHLLTGCWPNYGIVGIAWLGSLCRTDGSDVSITTYLGSSTWLIVAHELGHNFGASHTFQNGVGHTGGYMDYGNPYWNGVIQFNILSKPEICFKIASVLPTCSAFGILSSRCGDGILDQEMEECECVEDGPSCAGCANCTLTDPLRNCSSSTFKMVPKVPSAPTERYLAVANLEDPQCCSEEGSVWESDRKCGPGNKNVCVGGICQRFCQAYLLDSCPMIRAGCTQPCLMQGQCWPDLKTSAGVHISWVPDGSPCKDGAGSCQSGYCSMGKANDGTSSNSSLSPTRTPTRKHKRRKPTRRPRKRRRHPNIG